MRLHLYQWSNESDVNIYNFIEKEHECDGIEERRRCVSPKM